jgi:hypothetical protein
MAAPAALASNCAPQTDAEHRQLESEGVLEPGVARSCGSYAGNDG